MKISKKAQGARNRKAGDILESLAISHLACRGVLAQRIATPCIVRGGKKIYTSKVVGDIVGVGLMGQCVLVECKNLHDSNGKHRRPRTSDFRPHQLQAHKKWAERGALVFVAYFAPGGIFTLEEAANFSGKKEEK